jgi:hypothetical protein
MLKQDQIRVERIRFSHNVISCGLFALILHDTGLKNCSDKSEVMPPAYTPPIDLQDRTNSKRNESKGKIFLDRDGSQII